MTASPKPVIDPVSWRPPSVPERARARDRHPAIAAMVCAPVPGEGPEDVLVRDDGSVVTGLVDGRVVVVSPDGRSTRVVADTGGRPLGIEAYGDELVVCDAHEGLLLVDPRRGSVHRAVDSVGGVRMRFCNNAAVARDGTVWFTDSSLRHGIEHWRADLIEGRATGRLLRRGPDGTLDVVLEGLRFANGVALARDESWVAFAQTGAYRVDRMWLAGPSAGTVEPLAQNLPGFPDNISTGSDGLVWVALASPRNPLLDALLPRPGRLRRAVWALPESVQPQPVRTTWVMALDAYGTVVHDIEGQHPAFHMATGVRERNGVVWLGSLVGSRIAGLRL